LNPFPGGLNKSFRKKSNCFVYNYAISDKDGEADFNVSLGGSQNSSSLKKPTKLHSARFGKKPIKVKTCKLDTWYQETGLKTIDFIWSDVEGNERELINGGNNALKNTKYFYTEYTEKEYLKGQALIPEIIGLVSELGFEKVEVFPWFNKKEGKLWHFGDILFRNTSFGD
jgi:2-O-methyltransferase